MTSVAVFFPATASMCHYGREWGDTWACVKKHWHMLVLNICDGLVAAEQRPLWRGLLLRMAGHLCASGIAVVS